MNDGDTGEALDVQMAMGLAPLLACVEAHPGTWRTREGAMPYFEYGAEAERLSAAIYQTGLPLAFDWMAWSDQARQNRECPSRLAQADLPTLRHLLFYHLRADRFVEGHLAGVLGDGHLGSVLRRIPRLLAGDAASHEGPAVTEG